MLSLAANPVLELAVELIDESALNPRTHFEGLSELAASLIAGQLEAIIVRPHPEKAGRYELANGARRLRAARLAKKSTLEAKVCGLDDGEMFEIILGTGAAGNVDPLTPLEEAKGYAGAMDRLHLTLQQVAEKFAKETTYVHRRLALLQLPAEAQASLEKGELGPITAFEIARIPGEDKRAEAAKAILHSDVHGGVMPHRAAKLYIEKQICRSLQGAPFDVNDVSLVLSAGACSVCPYRAGNDRDTYGDVGNPHTCMHPTCFEAKVSAARARVLGREAAAGKTALSHELNDQVFPKGENGISWKSDYVAFTQPVPGDMLKPEVTKAPTWAQLCQGAGVHVLVGIDQSGRAVDVAKRDEVLAAVPTDEVSIFNDDAVRRHGLSKPARSGSSKTASIAEEEERERKLREKVELAKKRREKKSRAWLDDLVTGLEGMAAADKPAWNGYAYWSLVFDLILRALGDEDVLFVCELYGIDGNVDADTPARKALEQFAGSLSAGKCAALVTAMAIAPWLRAEGPDAAFVTEWHEAFVAEPSAETATVTPVVTAPPISKDESARLASLVKAYNGGEGMSPQRLTEEFAMSLEDVCGALQLDFMAVRNLPAQLRQDAEEGFESAGIPAGVGRNRIVKTVTAGRVKEFSHLSRPEDFRAVLRMLSNGKKAAEPAPPAPDEKGGP